MGDAAIRHWFTDSTIGVTGNTRQWAAMASHTVRPISKNVATMPI
jgi:hypothetical protein